LSAYRRSFFPDSDLDFVSAAKSPPALVAGGLVLFSISLAFTLGHGSPPAWMSHDDGRVRDGGGSASN
jgi:hypothetical protein